MPIVKSILFSLSLFTSTLYAANQNFTALEKKSLPNHLGHYQHIQVSSDETIDLYAAVLNEGYTTHLYVQPEKNQHEAKTLHELSVENSFSIGINGGFFTPNFNPAGLFIQEGKTIKRPVKNSLLRSCVGINHQKKMHLGTTIESCAADQDAIQTGPVMIEAGKIHDQIKNPPYRKEFFAPHRRTILAQSSDQKLLVIVTSAATLTDIAEWLNQHSDILGVHTIETALDLDGGASTGMYIRFEDSPFYFQEFKRVKTMLLFQ